MKPLRNDPRRDRHIWCPNISSHFELEAIVLGMRPGRGKEECQQEDKHARDEYQDERPKFVSPDTGYP